jgi:hypothetical protein
MIFMLSSLLVFSSVLVAFPIVPCVWFVSKLYWVLLELSLFQPLPQFLEQVFFKYRWEYLAFVLDSAQVISHIS